MTDTREARHGADLIEREGELTVAQKALDRVAKGDAEVLALVGPLGIGKSRLAAEICSTAEARGYRVRSERATQVEGEAVLPALVDEVARLSSDGPQLIFQDNVQWMDEDSLDLLIQFVRRARHVLLVLSGRSGQWPASIADWQRGQAAEPRVSAIRLRPLTLEGTCALVGDGLGPGAWDEGGGNPFFALALLAAVDGESTSRSAIPSTVRSAIAADVETLSPEAQALVRAAAVVGPGVDVDLVAAVSEIAIDDLARASSELTDRALMVTQGSAGLEFSAPIVRAAVYEDMGLASRLKSHDRTARLLEERGAPAIERAHHIAHGGSRDPGDVAILLEGAESILPRQRSEAALWLSAATARMPDNDGRQAGAIIRASDALLRAGRVREGREAYERFGARPAKDSLDGPQTLAVSRVEQMLGVAGQSRAALIRCLERQQDERSTVELRLALALEHWRAGERVEMAAEAGRALRSAGRAEDELLMADALGMVALAEYALGKTARAADALEQAERRMEAASDEGVATPVGTAAIVGFVSQGLERYAEASKHFERAIRGADMVGDAYLQVALNAGRGTVELAIGQLERARGTAEQALVLALRIDIGPCLIWAHGLTALVALAQGRAAAAVAAAQDATNATAGVAGGLLTSAARCCLGAAQIEAGQIQLGYEQLLRHGGGAELERVDAGARVETYATLAKAARLTGEIDAAERWVERAEAVAAELRLDGRIATADVARARLTMERQPLASAELAVGAADAFDGVGRIVDAGLALLVAGRARALSGDERRAVSTLEQAHAILTACGAEKARDLAARELRGLGQTISRPAGRGDTSTRLDALSGREREVAELVARGLTNQRIADEMFVSPKTVEGYLASAFAKLGVSSRAGLAAALESSRTSP